MKTKDEIIKWMTTNMVWVGFGNYSIAVKIVKKMKSLATLSVDKNLSRIVLQLPKSFFNLDAHVQENFLLHELMHGRECLKQQKVDAYTQKIKDDEEEDCVNDQTMLAQKWESLIK